jgi:hypothetical protein
MNMAEKATDNKTAGHRFMFPSHASKSDVLSNLFSLVIKLSQYQGLPAV